MTGRELILTSLLGCRREDLYLNRYRMEDCQKRIFDDMMSRLDQGEPLQYILGQAEFLGLRFDVDSRVLIPRPETELMVETLLKYFSDSDMKKSNFRILDIGTGSGCIAISLLKKFMQGCCDAVDVSPEALAVAEHNARVHGVGLQAHFHCCDIRDMWRRFSAGSYDVIVSNPPYIPTGRMNCLPSDVQKEPWIALDGGADGLMFLRDIIHQGTAALKTGGLMVCEFWDGQEQELQGMFDSSWLVKFFRDLSGTDRFFVARKNF